MPTTSIIGCRFWELIGCMSVTFGGAPNVANSLDTVYLGPFSPPLPRGNFDTCSKINKLAVGYITHITYFKSVGKVGSTDV